MADGQFDTSIKWPQRDPSTGMPLYHPATGLPIVKHRCPTGDCGLCMHFDVVGDPADYDSPVGYCVTFTNVQPRDGYSQYGTCYCSPAGGGGLYNVSKRYLFADFNRTWWAGTSAGYAESGQYQYCTHLGWNVAGDGVNITGEYGWTDSLAAALAGCAGHAPPSDPTAGDVPRDFGFGVVVSRNKTTGRRFMTAVGGVRISDGAGGFTVSPGAFYGTIELTDPGCAKDAGYVIPNQLVYKTFPCPVLGPPDGSIAPIIGWTDGASQPAGCGFVPCTERTRTAPLDPAYGSTLQYMGVDYCRSMVTEAGSIEPIYTDPDSGMTEPCFLAQGAWSVGGYAFVKGRIAPGVPNACDADLYICASIWGKRYNCFTRSWESTTGPQTLCVVGFVQSWQLVGSSQPAGSAVPYRQYLAVTSSGTCSGPGAACDDGAPPANPDFEPDDCPECPDMSTACPAVRFTFLYEGVEHVEGLRLQDGSGNYVGPHVVVACTNGVRVMTITIGDGHATFHQVVASGQVAPVWSGDAWFKTEDTTSDTSISLPSGTIGTCIACPINGSAFCEHITFGGLYIGDPGTITVDREGLLARWSNSGGWSLTCEDGIYTLTAPDGATWEAATDAVTGGPPVDPAEGPYGAYTKWSPTSGFQVDSPSGVICADSAQKKCWALYLAYCDGDSPPFTVIQTNSGCDDPATLTAYPHNAWTWDASIGFWVYLQVTGTNCVFDPGGNADCNDAYTYPDPPEGPCNGPG